MSSKIKIDIEADNVDSLCSRLHLELQRYNALRQFIEYSIRYMDAGSLKEIEKEIKERRREHERWLSSWDEDSVGKYLRKLGRDAVEILKLIKQHGRITKSILMEKKERREFALSYLHATYGFTLAIFAYMLVTSLFVGGYMVWVLYVYSMFIGVKLYKAYVEDFLDFPPIDSTVGILIDLLIPIMAYASIFNVQATPMWLMFNTILFLLAIGKCIFTMRDMKKLRETEGLGKIRGYLLRNIIYAACFFVLSLVKWQDIMTEESSNVLIIVSIPIIWIIGYIYKTKIKQLAKPK
jgi:hypothetical protein